VLRRRGWCGRIEAGWERWWRGIDDPLRNRSGLEDRRLGKRVGIGSGEVRDRWHAGMRLTPFLDPFAEVCDTKPLNGFDSRINVVGNVQIAAVEAVANVNDLFTCGLSGVIIRGGG